MGLFISSYDTLAEYNAVKDDILQPHVSPIEENDIVKYKPYHDYSLDYLTFVALENGTFTFDNDDTNNVLSYSTDGGSTWTVGNSVNVNSGDKILWKGENLVIGENYGVGVFSSTGDFNVEGNIGGLSFHETIHFVAVHICDTESGKFQVGSFYGKHQAVVECVVGILHFQVKLNLFLIVQLVAEVYGESVDLHLGFVDIYAVVGKGVLCDFYRGMVA